jgi:hypothetical protein
MSGIESLLALTRIEQYPMNSENWSQPIARTIKAYPD